MLHGTLVLIGSLLLDGTLAATDSFGAIGTLNYLDSLSIGDTFGAAGSFLLHGTLFLVDSLLIYVTIINPGLLYSQDTISVFGSL